MKRNMLNESAEEMTYRYIRCLAFTLKYSDYMQIVKRFNGFIDGLAWADFINSDEHLVLTSIVKSCYKSIRRHYRKEGRLL